VVFGTVALAAGTTPYDQRWGIVQSQALGSGAGIAAKARGLAPLRGEPRHRDRSRGDDQKEPSGSTCPIVGSNGDPVSHRLCRSVNHCDPKDFASST